MRLPTVYLPFLTVPLPASSPSHITDMKRSEAVRSLPRVAAAFLVAAVACAPGAVAHSQVSRLPIVHADTAALRRVLDSIADAHHGVVGYSVIDLESGERINRRGDETFPTASLIKVAILVTVYDLVSKGRLSLDDPLTVLKIDQVPGSGVVQFLHNGTVLTVHDAAWLMCTISDNTATNLLLDRIIIRRVWDKMDSLGLHHTRVHSKTFLRSSSIALDSSAKYGFGVTTPNEMAHLFELLAEGKAVNPAADSTMLDILEHNGTDFMLQRYAGNARAAHKDGEDNAVKTECTLWYLRNRVIACVMTKENKDQRWILDNEPQLTMANMGLAIINAFGGVPPAPASP
jgi:beta-lactamase class A